MRYYCMGSLHFYTGAKPQTEGLSSVTIECRKAEPMLTPLYEYIFSISLWMNYQYVALFCASLIRLYRFLFFCLLYFESLARNYYGPRPRIFGAIYFIKNGPITRAEATRCNMNPACTT